MMSESSEGNKPCFTVITFVRSNTGFEIAVNIGIMQIFTFSVNDENKLPENVPLRSEKAGR